MPAVGDRGALPSLAIVVVRRRQMPRLLALLLLSTASALRLPSFSSFWQLKSADLSVGDVVIPTMARRWEDRAAFRAARERMFAAGLYPGVDYAIEEAAIKPGGGGGGAEEERLSLTVRPIYPLIPKLEREWPITVPYEIAPRWMSPSAYNVLVAGGTLGATLAGLLAAAVLASAVTLSVVPSLSMRTLTLTLTSTRTRTRTRTRTLTRCRRCR